MSPKRKPGDTWRCQACGEPLIGAMTLEGKLAPIVLESNAERGNVILFRPPPKTALAGVLQARVISDERVLRELRLIGVPLHLNHFADCVHADRFRHTEGGVAAALGGER